MNTNIVLSESILILSNLISKLSLQYYHKVKLFVAFHEAVSGIVCMSDARCRNMMNVEPDEEAYCQFNFFRVGCCHVRKSND